MKIRRSRLAVALVALLFVAPVWNVIATMRAHRQNPVPGTMHDVGGYPMHIHCTGSGAPTVLLEPPRARR